MHLEALRLLKEVGFAGEERRHGDQGAQRRRNALLERKSGQDRRAEAPGHRAVDEGGRHLGRRQEPDQCRRQEPDTVEAGARQQPQRDGEQHPRQEQDRSDIAADAETRVEATDPQPRRRLEPDRPLKSLAALGDQVETGIAGAPSVICAVRLDLRPARGVERVIGDLHLRAGRASRQLLDGRPVEVPRGEIHVGEGAVRAQPRIDEADALEHLRPINVGDEPHAGDDVAHRDVGCALSLLGMLHDRLDRHALKREAFFQPSERRRRCRILVPQFLGQMRGEDFGQRFRRTRGDVRV